MSNGQNPTAVINGGTFENTNDDNFSFAVSSLSESLIINSGTFNAASGRAIQIRSNGVSFPAATVTINGGVINGDVFLFDMYWGDKDWVGDDRVTATINGGTLNGGFKSYGYGTFIVKGGTFRDDPSAYVPSSGYSVSPADGYYQVTQTSDGTSDN